MSVERSYCASMVVDGKIYAIGGCGSDLVPLNMVEVYDPQADSWQRVASMPCGVYDHAAAAMSDKIYVTGGETNQGIVNSAYVYDPQADAWTQLASMSTPRWRPASAAVGGKLYVFGGCARGLLITAEIYDPASDSWLQGPSLTSSRESMVAIAL